RNVASLRILAKLGFDHVESFIDESDGEHCERFVLDADVGTSLLAGDAMPGC
ncbi:MAG: N-acetyltransferase, partial [Mesorhizobium sp.]